MAKVLVADDSDAIRQVLHDILQIGKHELVGEAIDGNEAVKKFNELQPDLLLLDLAMPKKDGLTVVKEIIEFNPDARIILITASDNQVIISQCLDAGAIASISKPFDFDKVLKVISDALSV
ncbi:MAG: response regulator [Nitrosopumilaceae archaeon]